MQNNKLLKRKDIVSNLFVYGTMHALVDAICAGVVFSILRNQIIDIQIFFILVVLYNVLAFGLQFIFGFISDHLQSPRLITLIGAILTVISAFIFMILPIWAIIFAGLGNALFHVGGGSISLNLTPTKATAPGIYVAPGALGLFVGILLGKGGQFIAWPFVLGLIILSILIFIIKKPEMNYKREERKKQKFNYFGLILILVFLSITIRSFVGMVIVFPWKVDINLLIILTIAVVLGKAIGGILADKFGFIKVAVGALVLSIPLLILGVNIPILAIIGMFLFNITMPVTLVTISNILPGRPGFAFGLTCLALIIGAFPSFFPIKQVLSNNWFILSIINISAISLYFGLRLYYNKFINKEVL
jgi:FSR family fosmidomycin resistance protein-like MFS transporter